MSTAHGHYVVPLNEARTRPLLALMILTCSYCELPTEFAVGYLYRRRGREAPIRVERWVCRLHAAVFAHGQGLRLPAAWRHSSPAAAG